MSPSPEDEERHPELDDANRKLSFGWDDRLGFHLTGLSKGDVRCIAIAISFAIVVVAVVYAGTQIWDRWIAE